jgi:hypothetical protein
MGQPTLDELFLWGLAPSDESSGSDLPDLSGTGAACDSGSKEGAATSAQSSAAGLPACSGEADSSSQRNCAPKSAKAGSRPALGEPAAASKRVSRPPWKKLRRVSAQPAAADALRVQHPTVDLVSDSDSGSDCSMGVGAPSRSSSV